MTAELERRLALLENALRHMAEVELPRLTRELAEIRQLAGRPADGVQRYGA